MFFNIKVDKKVDKKLRVIYSFLYYSWIISLLLRIMIKMRDDANNVVSTFQDVVTYFTLTVMGLYIIISTTYWIKPNLYYKKESNEE